MILTPDPWKLIKDWVKNKAVWVMRLPCVEFETLWHGILVGNISRPIGQRHFQARAILMWTMNDCPGYGSVRI